MEIPEKNIKYPIIHNTWFVVTVFFKYILKLLLKILIFIKKIKNLEFDYHNCRSRIDVISHFKRFVAGISINFRFFLLSTLGCIILCFKIGKRLKVGFFCKCLTNDKSYKSGYRL